MGIRDLFNTYSNAQALTVTAASTDVIDHGGIRHIGVGEAMLVEITVDVVADFTTGDETYVAALQVDNADSFPSPVTIGSVTIPGNSAAGSRFFIQVPPLTNWEQFSRINYTLGGTTPSVTVTANLIPQSFVQNDFAYPDGFTITS